MATFSDTFTNTDGTDLSTHNANWTSTGITIQGNQAAGTGSTRLARVTGVTFGDDQFAQATIGTPLPSYTLVTLYVRHNGTSHFAAGIRSDRLIVYRGGTALDTDTSITWAAGNVARIEVEGDQIRVYKNGTLVKTVTDATTWSGTKTPGFLLATSSYYADFEGGDLAPAGPVAPNPPTGVSVGSITRTGATVSWTDASSDETGFEVEVAATPFSSWTAVATTAADATSQAITGLSETSVYKARVRSIDADAESVWVESGEFTTLTRKIKAVLHGSAVGETGLAGVVFAAPAGADITGARLGEFTGMGAIADGANAAVKIPLASVAGASALTTSDTPVVYVASATKNSPMVSATVLDE